MKKPKGNKKILPRTQPELLEYWRGRSEGENCPEFYFKHTKKSEFLFGIIKRFVAYEATILEPGCNVGRNLNYLFQKGYNNLHGIEINNKAIDLMFERFPDLPANIWLGSIEHNIVSFPDDEFDLVFTMAVLEHIHPDSEWIFKHLVRITKKYLLVIEDEHLSNHRLFPRKYKDIFEGLGMKQIEEIPAADIEGLRQQYIARMFIKE